MSDRKRCQEDFLNRRVLTNAQNSGDLDGTTRYYYNKNQIIETRDGSGNLKMQVYHGTRYIDEVVGLRLEQGRVYVHQDANYNVTALTDLTGRVLERYYYSPYGELQVVVDTHFFDYDDDGDVDAEDIAAATASGVCWGDYSGDCRRLDADCDRDIDADDYNAIVAYANTLSTDTEIQRIPAATESALGNPFAHQGLAYDAEIGSYQNRHRQYTPKLKRFMQRDPLGLYPRARSGYQDGANLSCYLKNNTLRERDPLGLFAEIPIPSVTSHRNRVKGCCQLPVGHSFVCVGDECHGAPSDCPTIRKGCTRNYPVCRKHDPDEWLEDPLEAASIPCDVAHDVNRENSVIHCLQVAEWDLFVHNCHNWVVKCLYDSCMKHCNPAHDVLDP